MNLQQNEIIQHATSSEDNLRIAIQVGNAFEELKASLIRGFANEIREALLDSERHESERHEVDVSLWEKDPLGKMTKLKYRSSNWPEHIFVCVEAQSSGGGNCLIGVLGEPGTIDENLRRLIAEQLNKNIAQGESDSWWCWRRYLDEPYINFCDPETLLALREKKKMCSYLVEQIKRIRKCVDDAVDIHQR